MKLTRPDIFKQKQIFAWIALGTGVILLIPLFAMQFTHEVRWDMSDFIVMGAILFGTSSAFVLAARKVDKKHRLALGIAFLIAFIWLWAELAVGIFANWGS